MTTSTRKVHTVSNESEATELMKQRHKEITERRAKSKRESREYYRRIRDAE